MDVSFLTSTYVPGPNGMNEATQTVILSPDHISAARPKRCAFNQTTDVPAEAIFLAERVNRQIGFIPGVERTNSKGGYRAQDFDIYGYDMARRLVGIRYNLTSRRRRGYLVRTRKAFVLAGVDEGEQIFCHPIMISHQQYPKPKSCMPEEGIRWAESKIYRVPQNRLHLIVRQGDLVLVPVRSIPRSAALVVQSARIIRQGGHLFIDGLCHLDEETGRIWTDGPVRIEHMPGQHKSINVDGRYEIVMGVRGFASIIDEGDD